MENKELFNCVPNYEGMYQVSNLGNVKSFRRYKSGKILKNNLAKDGYYKVSLCFKKQTTFKIHVLMAITFLNHKTGNRKIVVDHINNIKTDNRLQNLQIITQRKNTSKDQINGTSKYTGVSFDYSRNKWISSISIDGKCNHLGRFNSELKASIAYQNKLKKIT